MRILHKMIGGSPKEPERILRSRAALQKRQRQNIDKAKNLPSDPTLLNLSLEELSKKNCKERFGTFVSRCTEQQHLNLKFLADMNIEQALKTNPEGIPITVKDHIKADGFVSTCGFSQNVGESTENAEVIDLLIKEGCVPFAHTNVPLGLLNIYSSNNVWGNACNPYNRKFTTGGSSGGEGASVATRCSAFGIASDTAGSAKIPAAFCGVVGYKPTGSKRLTIAGRLGATGQQGPSIKHVDTSLGYITRSVDDLAWVCDKTLGKTITYNPYIRNPWNQEKYEQAKKKKLRFGYVIEDHEMKAVPAVRNCIHQSVELLRKNGHEVVEFNFPHFSKFRDFIYKVVKSTQFMKSINSRLGEEKDHEHCKQVILNGRYGKLRALFHALTATSQLERHIYKIMLKGDSTMDLLMAIAEKDIYKQRFLQLWNSTGIDILITPVTPFTAPLHNADGRLIYQLNFGGFPNVLEMPSGSLPIRLVRKDQTTYDDFSFYGRMIANSVKESAGLPVGIQLSSAFMDDQTCIGAMWQLERLLPPLPAPKPDIW